MKSFISYIKEQRENIIKSWYHPDSGQEIVVDGKPSSGNWGGLDSHSNHLFQNHHLYGFDSIDRIFTNAGHSPEIAKELVGRIKTHHETNGGYVDWHDPLVHAMHKNGWVRVVKGNDWDTDKAHLYVGSHDQSLNRRAAKHLQNDGVTKMVSLSTYKGKDLNDKNSFDPPARAKFEDYEI
jgi:hypothetical protein